MKHQQLKTQENWFGNIRILAVIFSDQEMRFIIFKDEEQIYSDYDDNVPF